MEQPIAIDYPADLSDAYALYFPHYTAAPILIVNTTGMDFVNDPGMFEMPTGEILRPSDARLCYVYPP